MSDHLTKEDKRLMREMAIVGYGFMFAGVLGLLVLLLPIAWPFIQQGVCR